jgi:L-threonylcarbamoyladenylate synthase
MVIIDYKKQFYKQIIAAAVRALKAGKAVAYPTDTSYGLAVDAGNSQAIKKLYKIKGRNFNKPVHVVVPSVTYGKKIVRWNPTASKLAKKFWPGPLTLVLMLRAKGIGLKMLSAGNITIGLRMPKNKIAQDLAKYLGRPITATSANVSGRPDCYSADDIIGQFKNQKYHPDIIINAGKLPKRKPSTLVSVSGDVIKILRRGPISEKQINSLLNTKEYEKY